MPALFLVDPAGHWPIERVGAESKYAPVQGGSCSTTFSQRSHGHDGEGIELSQTVSFILPVRNFQYGLKSRVSVVTEVLAELTPAFDVLIIDYGSTDDTREIAMDLVREFPQVDYLERPSRCEVDEAIEFGVFRTAGETIFVHDPRLPLGVSAIHNLWQMRNDEDLVMAQSRWSGEESTIFPTFSGAPAATSVQMIRRCAIPAASASQVGGVVDRVTRTDLLDSDANPRRLPKLLSRLKRSSNAQ